MFQIQRRVGFAGAVACAGIAILNFVAGLSGSSGNFVQTLGHPSVYLVLLFGAAAFSTACIDSVVARGVQVAVFIGYSYLASLRVDPGSLHGAVFGVYGIVLALQYNMFGRWFYPKMSILVAGYLVVGVLSAASMDEYFYHVAPGIVIMIGLFVYLFWAAFAEEIKEHTSENRALKEERDKNEVFVNFGLNISGVVHNLKSSLMSIEGCTDLLRSDAEPGGSTPEILDLQKRSTDRMLEMINNFMTAVRSYQQTEAQPVALNDLVRGSVELLKGNSTLRNRLKIECELSEPDTIYAVPMEIMQVIDNLVTNAAEAMLNTDRYHLKVATSCRDRYVELAVIDQGTGIEFCDGCTERKCERCRRFSIGKTTKVDGAGIGMVYVQLIVREMNGKLRIRSKTDAGTEMKLYFPKTTG